MLKHFVTGLAAAVMILPATAQNAGEIARVQNGQSCAGCNLFQADLAYLDLKNVDVSGARLRQADLQLSTLEGWNLSNANLSLANLFGARFNASSFAGANLERATLVGAYFGRSNFKGADLTATNISGADLSIAQGLSQAQLDRACGDNTTMLPEGLTVPACR